jgi:hypothetical protein
LDKRKSGVDGDGPGLRGGGGPPRGPPGGGPPRGAPPGAPRGPPQPEKEPILARILRDA